MTLGESRVRKSFNPSGNELADQIKAKTAELIDLCEIYRSSMQGEPVRCWAIAMTEYESAAMWAVKGATYVATS